MELKYWPGTSFMPPEFAFRTGDPESIYDLNWEVASYPGGPRSSGRRDEEMTAENGWTTLVIPTEDVPQNYLS